MTVNWEVLSFVIVAIAQIFAIAGCYYGLKADNAKLASSLALAIVTLEGNIKDLGHRVTTVECGQDEWTKALRTRTHELANQMNNLVIRVDRLERPGHHGAAQ